MARHLAVIPLTRLRSMTMISDTFSVWMMVTTICTYTPSEQCMMAPTQEYYLDEEACHAAAHVLPQGPLNVHIHKECYKVTLKPEKR